MNLNPRITQILSTNLHFASISEPSGPSCSAESPHVFLSPFILKDVSSPEEEG